MMRRWRHTRANQAAVRKQEKRRKWSCQYRLSWKDKNSILPLIHYRRRAGNTLSRGRRAPCVSPCPSLPVPHSAPHGHLPVQAALARVQDPTHPASHFRAAVAVPDHRLLRMRRTLRPYPQPHGPHRTLVRAGCVLTATPMRLYKGLRLCCPPRLCAVGQEELLSDNQTIPLVFTRRQPPLSHSLHPFR